MTGQLVNPPTFVGQSTNSKLVNPPTGQVEQLRDPATNVMRFGNFVGVAVDLALLQAKAPAQLAFLLKKLF
jgi:hypothetical protein